MPFDAFLNARWAGVRSYHIERATRWCRRGIAAYMRGDRAGAQAWFLHTLARYPDDPNALHALGRLQLEDGSLADAEASVRRALDIYPGITEFRATLASILDTRRMSGRDTQPPKPLGARRTAPAFARKTTTATCQAPSCTATTDAAPRAGACPCGSGRRYKHCCGRLDRPSAALLHGAADDQRQSIAVALAEFDRGEATSAMRRLAPLAAPDVADAAAAAAIAAAFAQLDAPERALEFQRRAVELDGGAELLRVLNGYCEALYRRVTRASAHATARTLLAGAEPAAVVSESRHLHIIGSLAALGGTENRALELHALLSPHTASTLWSVTPPHPIHAARAPIRVIGERNGDVPDGGTLVFVGTFFDYGDWLHGADASRFIVHHNIDLPIDLVQRLTQISETTSGGRIELVFPSERFRRLANLPGTIDISWVDPDRFVPAMRIAAPIGELVIGRHSRDDPGKHHPNDPALYRQLVAHGHRCRIMGGLPLRHAFEGDLTAKCIELLPTGSEDPRNFLATLDCFVYRKNPAWFETGGTVILEAMAMALPVIVFDDERCGATEWIEPGVSGFVVRTEEEALAAIARLAQDPELRARTGAAARARAIALATAQRAAAFEFYFGDGEVLGRRPVAQAAASVRSSQRGLTENA